MEKSADTRKGCYLQCDVQLELSDMTLYLRFWAAFMSSDKTPELYGNCTARGFDQ
ncbi:MAG: hypothetical protein ACJAVM_000337 [Sulfitobacter sp.]|jgi:hypothetical protein